MKKNLRIVSAAAAALLAVAPVAATVVSVAPTATVQAADAEMNFDGSTQGMNPSAGTWTVNSNGVDNVPSGKLSSAEESVVSEKALRALGLTGVKGLSVVVTPDTTAPAKVGGKYIQKYTITLKFKGTDDEKTQLEKVWNKSNATINKNATTPNTHYAIDFAADGTIGSSATTPYMWHIQKDFNYVTPTKPTKPTITGSTSVNAGSSSIFAADGNTNVNLSAVAKHGNIPSSLNGNITATLNGQQYTAMLHTSDSANTVVYETNGSGQLVTVDATTLKSNKLYYALFKSVSMNLGNAYANKSVSFTLPNGSYFAPSSVAGAKYSNYDTQIPGANGKQPRTITVTADANGVANLGTVVSPFYAYDATNLQEVHFYSQKTGNVVQNGSLDLHAVNGQLNVESLLAAMSHEYVASQLVKGTHSIDKIDTLVPQNDLRDQLKKQNIEVDPNGYFKAPASFTLNLNAKSKINGATATLPVTINVDNVTATAAQETTKTVTIMHISTIYDKNGKATHDPALRAYDTYSVVSTPVTLKDEKGNNAGTFYKLAGKDQYIKVGNVDGTSRSLKHNSYVYKSTGKRSGKKVLKKGSSVTTYGKSFMIAGHQMYRIGKNQYVKKANF